jgi:hypothetical protein
LGEDILARLDEVDRKVDHLKVQVTDVQEKMRDVLIELGGAPDAEYRDPHRKSIRTRLHDFENFVSSNTLAETVIRSAREERRQVREHAWSQRHTLAMFSIAVILMLVTLLQFFGVTP